MTYFQMAQRARNATPEQVEAMALVLLRIYEAHRTGNCGAIIGEAHLCDYFTSAARTTLTDAGVLE